MADQITFTDDVIDIATAANADGSIRWHVYSRAVGGSVKIYVRRETPPGTLEPQVLFLQEGEKPEIFFDTSLAQFVLIFRFNENAWWVRIDETTVPVTQPTITTNQDVSGFAAASLGEQANPDSVAGREAQFFAEAPQGADMFNGPRDVTVVKIAPSPTPGMFEVRWTPQASTNANGNAQWVYGEFPMFFIAGFNVYRRNFSDGGIVKLNGAVIPFVGFDPHLYVFTTPAIAGTYYVIQVNYRGPQSLATEEGRLAGAPQDSVFSDGLTLPSIIEAAFPSHLGDGMPSDQLRFVYTDRSPITLIQVDFFPSHLGEGFEFRVTTTEFTEVQVADSLDTFPSHLGEGFAARFTQTGQGSVVVG